MIFSSESPKEATLGEPALTRAASVIRKILLTVPGLSAHTVGIYDAGTTASAFMC